MLLGMLQWLVTSRRQDLCCLVSSLKRFEACPRKNHLNLAVRALGYLKKVPNLKIAIDHRSMQFNRIKPDYEVLKLDFLLDYLDAKEETDPDSDHAHDLKTRRFFYRNLWFCWKYASPLEK